eukprot:scaffold53004_cov56-Attheya_sp.AAC.2
MSEAHIQLPLGKWSATTCIDRKLPHAIKCQTCLASDDLRSLGPRKATSKKKKKKQKGCTQPWSTSFKESKEQSKRIVYNKVWVHLIAKGYHHKGGDGTSYGEEESSYEDDARSFRRNALGFSEKEKVDAISIIENSIPDAEVNGRKPTSPPSNCENLQSYTILLATTPPDPSSDLMSAANLILQFTQGAQVASSIPNEIDTATSSLTSTTSSLITTRSDDPPPPSDETRKSFTTSVSVSTNGKEVVLDVPTSHKVVNKAHLSRIKTKADQLDALTRQVSFGKYAGTAEGNRLLGAAMALSPQTSADAMALTIPLVYAALFANAKIAIDAKRLALSAPSSGTLKNLVADGATDSMFVCLESIRNEGSRVFLTCDKGGHENFVNFLSWYNKKEGRVATFNLDNDKVGGTSRDCALAVKHSLNAFYSEEDAKNSLWANVQTVVEGRQLTLGSPITKVLGDGGLTGKGTFRATAMQLLHGWSVKEATQKINFRHVPFRLPLSLGGEPSGVINRHVTTKKANQIASGVQSLMGELTIRSDVHIIAAFHEYYLFSHFAWLQKGDPDVGNTPGFLARHIGVRYFLMHSQLVKANTDEAWRNIPEFDGVVKSINLIPDEKTRQLQADKVKHEANTAQVVSQFLLEQQSHGFAENGIKMRNRQTRNTYVGTSCTTPVTRGYHRAIADGMDMWATPCPMRLAPSKIHDKECFAALATNSHMAERGVKAANFCTTTGRPEYLSSAYGTARSGLVEPIYLQARTQKEKDTTRRGNRHVLSGTVGERKRTNGEIYDENNKSATESVRDCASSMGGSLHAEQAIKFVTHRHKCISDACNNSELLQMNEWKRVSRVTLKTEEYKNTFNIERIPNVIQWRTGADITAFMQGKAPFGKLFSPDWENLKIELLHRGLSTDGMFNACKTRLQVHEGDKQDFRILSDAPFKCK